MKHISTYQRYLKGKHKNIRRLDDKYLHVRIKCCKQLYSKMFIINQFKSNNKAIEAAINYRDSLRSVLKFAKENNLVIKDW